MGEQSRRLTGFRIRVFDIATGTFSSHSVRAKNLAGVRRSLTRPAGHNHDKQERIHAELFMVLANRYDW